MDKLRDLRLLAALKHGPFLYVEVMASIWGSIPDVFTAAAAIGALIAAWAAWRQSQKLLQREAARDELSRERDRQEQASKVFAWTAVRVKDGDHYGAVVTNSSDQAIYRVIAVVTNSAGQPRTPIRLSVLPPGPYFLEENDTYGWEFSRRLRTFEEEIRPVNKAKRRVVVSLCFRDSHNEWWWRDRDGVLHPGKSEAAVQWEADDEASLLDDAA